MSEHEDKGWLERQHGRQVSDRRIKKALEHAHELEAEQKPRKPTLGIVVSAPAEEPEPVDESVRAWAGELDRKTFAALGLPDDEAEREVYYIRTITDLQERVHNAEGKITGILYVLAIAAVMVVGGVFIFTN